MVKFVFESQKPITLWEEDNRQSLLINEGEPEPVGDNRASCLVVEVRSYDEEKNHTDILKLEGKKIRVTVEVMD
jgi:hypothetical protein